MTCLACTDSSSRIETRQQTSFISSYKQKKYLYRRLAALHLGMRLRSVLHRVTPSLRYTGPPMALQVQGLRGQDESTSGSATDLICTGPRTRSSARIPSWPGASRALRLVPEPWSTLLPNCSLQSWCLAQNDFVFLHSRRMQHSR